MLKLIHKLQDRLGRRGTVLLVFSLVFLFIGIKALLDPSQDSGRFVFYTLLPPVGRFILWVIPALLGFLAAILHKGPNDAYGFSALAIPASVLMVSYVFSFVGHFFGLTPYATGWVQAIEWALILVLLLVTSGWEEAPRHPHIIKETNV